MARVDYIDPIHHLSGKIARRHRTTYCYRQDTGAKFTSVYQKSSKDPSPAQAAINGKFRQAAAEVKTILADMTQAEAYRKAWEMQRKGGTGKYQTLRGFIFAQVFSTL